MKTSASKSSLLPKTDKPAFESANKEVEHVLYDNSPVGKGGTKRKRGNYNNWQDMPWKMAFRMRQENLPKNSASL